MSYRPRESGPDSSLDYPMWREEDPDTTMRETYPVGELLALDSDRTIEHGVFSSSFPVDDTTALVQDPADNTKLVRIDVGAVTALETRVITMPDANVDLSSGGSFVSSSDAVLRDGTLSLTADWDAGSFKITAETLESDVATGTAPFTIASATLNTNLNADLLDGNHAAAFALAPTVFTDNALIRGDGGAKGIQDSGVLLDDTDNMLFPGAAKVQLDNVNQYLVAGNATTAELNAVTTIQLSIGGSSEIILIADELVFSQAGGDVGFGWGTNNELDVKVGGVGQVTFTDGTFEPVTINDIDIGTATKLFKDGHLAGSLFFRDAAIHISSDSDGDLDLEADVSIDFEIGGTEQMTLTAAGLNVDNAVRCATLRADGENAGIPGTVSLTGTFSETQTGAASTLRSIAGAKESGPIVAAASGWMKIFAGGNARWVQYWT